MDLNLKNDSQKDTAPEKDNFQVVEWNIRPNNVTDTTLDNGCGCDCGCDEMA